MRLKVYISFRYSANPSPSYGSPVSGFCKYPPPLENLKDEDTGIHGILARREAKNHFTILRESFAEREVIIEHLQDYRDHIVLFHFSGHAGGDGLMMEDGKGNAEGIAELLGQCPNLELVILNG
ncbi:MAG: hypothetical protein H6559_05595 [Lewinellaceae bacterium]|nr:hypothetical protein [Lewinellaceae bacterium]